MEATEERVAEQMRKYILNLWNPLDGTSWFRENFDSHGRF